MDVFKKYALFLILTATIAAGCKNSGGDKTLPSVSGKAGEVAVVCSKAEWEGEPGSTLRSLLSDEVPYLPQVEPKYDLFNVPQQAFNKIFQVHRNIIVINTEKKNTTPDMRVWTNVWAKPQLVIEIVAETAQQAAAIIAQNGKRILSTLEKTERNRVLDNISSFENADLRRKVNAMVGGSPLFPNGFTVKKQTSDFIWLSSETTYTIQSILVWKYPYSGPADLNPEALAAKRNEITKEHIPCTMEGSYMILNPDIMPGCDTLRYKGRDIIEQRGLWEAHNDFMGGPFVSHTFLTPDQKEIVTMDAFVYAPRYDKRNYLRQVEACLYSFDWNNIPSEE